MKTTSSNSPNSILYDESLSLFYLYIAPTIKEETISINISLDINPQFNYITDPGVVFTANLDINTSFFENDEGAIYYITIDRGSSIYGSASESDFSFVG